MGRDRTPSPPLLLHRRRLLQIGAAALAACGGSGGKRRHDSTAPAGSDSGSGSGTDSGGIGPDGSCGPGAESASGDVEGARSGSFSASPFGLGVASGDPLHDRVVLWTRLVVEPTDVAATPDETIDVIWELGLGPELSEVVQTGLFTTDASVAHSVHVDVDGLEADTVYHYRFRVGEFVSPVGRTRTLPCDDATPDRWRMGFATCQYWMAGYYAAHRSMAEQELDLIVFLGDYIYEGGTTGGVRDHGSSEPVDLEGYRNRYGLYRSDPDLQASHASAPWVVIQDDHEVDNNYAGVVWSSDADRRARLVAAYQAWWEHMPVRTPPRADGGLEVSRSLWVGTLAQVVLLDGRQHRDAQPCNDEIGPRCPETDDERQFLGVEQEAWLEGVLAEGAPRWAVFANPVVMLPMDFGGVFLNPDQWDGYPGARQRFLDMVAQRPSTHPVLFSGDIHSSGWGWVPEDPFVTESTPVVSEVVVTPISSRIRNETFEAAAPALAAQPHIGFFDIAHNGWVEAELTPETMVVRYHWVEDAEDPGASSAVARTLTLTHGTIPGDDPDAGR